MAMIQANDLRVGNILQSYEGSEFEYVVIQSGDILMCQEANENFNNWRKPIPITEEWLLRMGFESLEDGWYKIEEYTWNIYDKGFRYKGQHIAEPDYIHQLQNLYHALTGEELTIKP